MSLKNTYFSQVFYRLNLFPNKLIWRYKNHISFQNALYYQRILGIYFILRNPIIGNKKNALIFYQVLFKRFRYIILFIRSCLNKTVLSGFHGDWNKHSAIFVLFKFSNIHKDTKLIITTYYILNMLQRYFVASLSSQFTQTYFCRCLGPCYAKIY